MTRSFPRALAACVVCLALAACSKPPSTPLAESSLCAGCNVILISMDTVRADHLGVYGHEAQTTPNIGEFAKTAVVFDDAVSQSSWTLPAHGAMMTGLYPGRLGVSHYPAKRKLPTGVDMLAEVFHDAGYATAGFTGGGFLSSHFGFDRGFDVYMTDGRRFEHSIDETLAWLDQSKGRRFFLFFHGYDAHRPYFSTPADKKAMGIPRGPSEKRGFCVRGRRDEPSKEELDGVLAYYDASIHMADRYVGRLLDAVRSAGLMDNTVILITSDHGEEFFEHGNCDHVRFLYHEIVNVPYILYVPRLSPDGRRVREPIPASISVPRTLLEIVGIEHSMPGVSLVPILHGKSNLFGAVFSEADSVVGQLGSRGATVAMTAERYKLVSYLEEGTDEAYDLVRDPGEQQILPESHDAYGRRQSLRAWYASLEPLRSASALTMRERTSTAEPPENDARPPESATRRAAARDAAKPAPPPTDGSEEKLPDDVEEHLRSLGYLE